MKTLSVLLTGALLIGASLLATRLQAAHALPAERAQSISIQASTDANQFHIAQK